MSFFASEFRCDPVNMSLLSEGHLNYVIDGYNMQIGGEGYKKMQGHVDGVHVTVTYHENFRGQFYK